MGNAIFSNEPRVAGRKVVARGLMVKETSYVIVFDADGNITDDFFVTCYPLEFSDKLLERNPAYDLTIHPDDPNTFNYLRKIV